VLIFFFHYVTSKVQKYYDYKISSAIYKKEIPPGKEDSFGLEYLAEFPYGDEYILPNDEVIRLIVDGIEINGKPLKIEDIYFVPETALPNKKN